MAKEVIGRFPIDQLAFIFVSGFFLTVAFPFDFSKLDFSRGLPSMVTLCVYAKSHFAPFVGVSYLGMNFPIGLIMMILLSIPTGVFIFFFYDLFRSGNHIVMQGIKHVFGSSVSEAFRTKKNDLPKEFYDWIEKRRAGKFWDFINVMELVSVGLFYSSELLLLIILFSCLFGGTLDAVVGASVLCVFLYLALRIYDKRYNDLIASLNASYEEEEVKPD